MPDDVLEETLQGLWRTLIRLVPTQRREDAHALANAIHHFAERSGYQAGRADERRCWEDRASADAARLQHMPCPTDAAPTWKDEARAFSIFDKPDTAH